MGAPHSLDSRSGRLSRSPLQGGGQGGWQERPNPFRLSHVNSSSLTSAIIPRRLVPSDSIDLLPSFSPTSALLDFTWFLSWPDTTLPRTTLTTSPGRLATAAVDTLDQSIPQALEPSDAVPPLSRLEPCIRLIRLLAFARL